MKGSFLFIPILFAFAAGCDEKIEPTNEIPENIIETKPCLTLYSRIKTLFPELKNNELSQSILFGDTVQKNIILTRDTDVYLTFISEGARFNNTFGWYTYTKSDLPQGSGDFEKHVLFPNVSRDILAAGDRLKLNLNDEKFKEGTVIGFFLITNGWQNGFINYSKTTQYTNFSMNVDQLQQHILFVEETCGDMVLSFEDISLNDYTCDHDFNDIIFTISDNNENLKNSSFEQSGIVKL